MKNIEFAKRWRRKVSDTVTEEYPAGSKVDVADDIAKEAVAAKVLKGSPVDVPAEPETPPVEGKKAKA